jgi:hypothetical protein
MNDVYDEMQRQYCSHHTNHDKSSFPSSRVSNCSDIRVFVSTSPLAPPVLEIRIQ